jgi:hypothetical protein
MCSMSCNRHIAISYGFGWQSSTATDESAYLHGGASVCTLAGTTVRKIGTGVLRAPQGIACSAFVWVPLE